MLQPPLLPAVPEDGTSSTCSLQAELISWSKGFQCTDVEGKDVVQLLQAAISKQEVGAGWGSRLGGLPHTEELMVPHSWTALPRGCCGPAERHGGHHDDVQHTGETL